MRGWPRTPAAPPPAAPPPSAPPCAGRRAAAAGGCRLSPKVFGSASPHDVWMIYCIVGVNITDGHICRCCYCCKQPKVSGRHGDASLNFRTLLLLPLAMSLGMSYKPNLNAHIPGTPLNPGKSAAATGWQVWEASGGCRTGTWGKPRTRVCAQSGMAGQRLRAAITRARPPAGRRRQPRSAPPPRRAPRPPGPAPPPPPLRGSGRRVSSMLGSPGRLIDLDQEYSGGASARTAAGGTPQVRPLAPRLASPHASSGGGAAPGRAPRAGGEPRSPELRRPRHRRRLGATLGQRSPVGVCPASRAEEPAPLAGDFLGMGGHTGIALFLKKLLFKNHSSSLDLYRSPSNFPL